MAGPCDGCSECCRLLPVDDIQKPAETPCRHQRNNSGGCCSVYDNRPAACATFMCLFLASQYRAPQHRLDAWLRPDKTHVVFYRSGIEEDPRAINGHVDPEYPDAWRSEIVSGEISRLLLNGAVLHVTVRDTMIVLKEDQPAQSMTISAHDQEQRQRAAQALPQALAIQMASRLAKG